MGLRYSIDFVAVDDRHRTAPMRDWRTLLASEPPERFFAYGRPILAPGDGMVIDVHDGEIDHEARRSQLTWSSTPWGRHHGCGKGSPRSPATT
jgi:hypothetical protein